MSKAQKTLLLFGIIILLAAIYSIDQITNSQDIDLKEGITNSTIEKPFTFKNVSLENFNTSKNALYFFENKGQISKKDHDILYVLETNGVACYLKPDGIIYSFVSMVDKDTLNTGKSEDKKNRKIETATLFLKWQGANPNVTIKAEKEGKEIRNYYNTGVKEGITGVKSFEKITYENIYNNIDLIFYTKENELKYDFIIKPDGNVNDIRLAYNGNKSLRVNQNGELVIVGELGQLIEGKPYTFQSKNSYQTEVSSEYKIEQDIVTFKVGEYDKEKDLIIDPTLLWATYYGVTGKDEGLAVCSDKSGNVYLAGWTQGRVDYISDPNDIPFDGHDNNFSGGWDAFLVKFDATGNRIWATYYGGFANDAGQGVCTDAFGNVYLAGFTESDTDIAHNGHDNIYNETLNAENNRFHRDAFLVKFNSEGIRQWATYYGGEDGKSDDATGVCIDAAGNVYMTGYTLSSNGIAHNGYDNTLSDNSDAFLVKFNSSGTRIWGTYLGKLGVDRANAICSDVYGNIFIAGNTESAFLGHPFAHDVLYGGKTDAFLAKFDSDGDFKWFTYYGGNEKDQGLSVATDNNGSIYLAGQTYSTNVIAYNGYDETYNGGATGDAFLVKFNPLGTREWGTYYGGTGSESNTRIATNKYGDVFMTGSTRSDSGIATNLGIDQSYNGSNDGYLVRFNSNGQRQWGTYYGGANNDNPRGITSDVSGNIYICGMTYSFDGISHNGHKNERSNPEYYVSDAFLAKFKPYSTSKRPGADDFKNPINPNSSNGLGKVTSNARYKAEVVNSVDLIQANIYPNPVSEELHVAFPNFTDTKTSIEVIDLNGREIFSKEVLGEVNEVITINSWQRGIYLVRLKNASQEVSRKIVVQ